MAKLYPGGGNSVYLNWLNATCAIISNEASEQNGHALDLSNNVKI